MKKILNTIIYTAIIMAVSSCSFFEEDKSQKDPKEISSIEGLAPEIKAHIVEQDSLMKDLVNKVDTMAVALNQAQKENSELREKIENIQSPRSTWAWMSMGAIALSIIALLLALFRRGLNEHEVRAVVGDRLDSSQRIKELIFNVNSLKNEAQRNSRNTSSSSSNLSSSIESRIQKLEKTLQEVVSYLNSQKPIPTPQQTSNSQQERISEVIRAGYANINTGKYFTKILDSNQETCVFSIKFKNERKGEFTIISLDKIKSRNGWQEVVEYTGSIEDATSFKETEKGICEKYDENTWEVTKPLKIRLLK
ncbi:MAG: hypothetical protein IJ081_03765 [Prevotella sp.]|nr:hypothetical protein [Prevotella sp.]